MPATAALIAVAFPFKIPVIDVEMVIAGVVVAVATLPAKPFADAMDALVTVPVPPALPHVGADAPLEVNTCPVVPAAVNASSVPLPIAADPAVGVFDPLIIKLIR